jgi:hypothetical protein
MGRLLIILLVMLLPLRGWSAERMAVQMAPSLAIVEVAEVVISMDGMPIDCPMLGQSVSKDGKSSSSSLGKSSCQTCELCMALASLTLPQNHLLTYVRQAHPMPTSSSFISADLAPQVEPPIL